MEGLEFICRNCSEISGMKLPADEKRELFGLQVLTPMQTRQVNFYCEHCGTANSITISPETFNLLMVMDLDEEK
jgi:hypothetical protein